MASCNDQNLVYNFKISSVGPGRITGSDVVYELSGLDLAMKLHYVKGVYFFSSQATRELNIMHIKETTFYWLNEFYMICGRFRRSEETGRPYMKCNDCGVRMVEAQCDLTIDEWLEKKDCSLNKLLVYHQPIGPELCFSPPTYLQVTKFKCGGMSLGLSWAHVLGDPFSASDCVNMWSPFFAGLKSNRPLQITKSPDRLENLEPVKQPLSMKRVNQVSQLLSKIWGENPIKEAPLFESLCAMMWQCIAKVREEHEPKIVTICKKDPSVPKTGILSNSQIISSVEADFSIKDSDLEKLANLLVDRAIDEKNQIEKMVEKDNGSFDYIIYGGNLTFVNFENINLYGLKWNKHKPKFVHYTIQGVGDEGAVFVLPWPEKDCDERNGKGRVVTVVLPEKEVTKLRYELKGNGLLIDGDLE
uniref:Protein ECERIFERUM 26-like n=1 Tax=Manihot esculenta TaxID=3983 RepID=A0A2C9W7M1_MANES